MGEHDMAQWIGLVVLVGGAAWRMRYLATTRQLKDLSDDTASQRRDLESRLTREDDKLHARVTSSRDELRGEIEKVETVQAQQGVVLGRIEGRLESIQKTLDTLIQKVAS